MRVAVVGLGGVGAYCAARMAQAGLRVYGIAPQRHVDAIRQRHMAIQVTSISGDCSAPLEEVATDASGVGEVDLVVVACKAYHLEAVAGSLAPLIGPSTAVLPLLNGIEAPEVLARHVGAGHLLGGLIRVSAHLESPGVVVHTGCDPGHILAGPLPGTSSDAVRQLAALQGALKDAVGLRLENDGNIQAAMWIKLVEISALSTVCALAQSDFSEVWAFPRLHDLMATIILEGCQVARAHGVTLDGADLGRKFLGRLADDMKKGMNGKPSMARDVEAGRISEMEVQIGALVRKGEGREDVHAPTLGMLYALLAPQDARCRRANGLPQISAPS
eukprot:jgi/Mesen1/7108/ME000369S06431